MFIIVKKREPTYLLFFFSFAVVIFTAVFLEQEYLAYVKPSVVIALIFIYIKNVIKINFWYPISMLVLILSDSMIYIDFVKYFDYIAVVIIIYYAISTYLLRSYISFSDIRIKKIFSLPILISLMLIIYLIYSITNLILPNLGDSIVSFFLILIALMFFVNACFLIYMVDKYKGSYNLLITACSCFFVNALLVINYFYFYSRVFTVLVNFTEIIALLFFVRFLIDVKLLNFDEENANDQNEL